MLALNILSQALFVFPFVIILINNFLPKSFSRNVFYITAACAAVIESGLSAVLMLLLVRFKLNVYDFNIFYAVDEDSDFFGIRRLSLFFMICVGMVAFVSAMISKKTIHFKKRSYVNLLMCLLLGMNGMLLATDLFTLYVFLEIVGISSFVMIAMFRSRTGLEGSFKYLVLSAVGVALLLVGLSFVYIQTGSLEYSKIGLGLLFPQSEIQKVMSYFAIILMICGFAVKAGIVPFHSWLPDAHQSADTAVSVLLSGIVIKVAGIYGLIVIRELFGHIAVVCYTYRVLGLVSILYGALLAARQDHFKRICAYSSVSQMGYVLLALSAPSRLGLIAAAAHVFSHAVFKSTLFTNAAAIHEQTGTLDINELGGLEKKMPFTAFSSVIAFFSTAGIPPCAGFWSKLLIVLALWQKGSVVSAGAALVVSIFTGVYFLRLQKKVFFGKPNENTEDVVEIRGTVRFIETALTVLTIGVGLAFPFILRLLESTGLIF